MLALITTLAAVLRFHSLAAKSFWFDEGVSVAIARLDWYNFARILWRREANMSLYYFFLHYWLYFGGSEFFVRALSVLFAIASVPAIYLLGRRLFDSQVGLTAAALLAVNAYHVQYSQDARSYSLMVFLCLLSSLYFLKSLTDPSARNRAAYVVSSALALYAQFFSLLLLIAQWLSLKALDRGQIPRQIRNDWRWIALLVSPVLVFVATTGTGPLRWVQRPGLRDLWIFALDLTGNGAAVAPRVPCGVCGRAASGPALANADLLGNLALPVSCPLAGFSNRADVSSVAGQAAFCSQVLHFLPARPSAAGGLRSDPPSPSLAEDVRRIAPNRSFRSGGLPATTKAISTFNAMIGAPYRNTW